MYYHPGGAVASRAHWDWYVFAVIAHHLLNMNWYKTLFRGRWGARRILLTCSGYPAISCHAFDDAQLLYDLPGLVFDVSFLPVRFFWRDIHVFSCAWGFLLVAFHLGLHLHGALKNIERKLKRTGF